MRADLCGLDLPAFSRWLKQEVGHSARFHRASYRQVMHQGRWAPMELAPWQEAAATSSDLPDRLAALATPDQAPTISTSRQADDPEHGTTTKVLVRLQDGREAETVHIPMAKGGHHTVCVSSQVGCRMGCTFCHTATMGLVRSLAAHEIIGQVVAITRHAGVAPRNVVFMGMGEPLDNLDAVATAVRILTDPAAFSLAYEHITISTVGRADVLPRLVELGLHKVNLAVSLTVAEDGLRSELMPVNRVHPLAALKTALSAIPLAKGRRLLVSCVVIPGVTDTPALLTALVEWCRGLPVLVNLIPFNPIPSRPAWRAPIADEVQAVRTALDRAGIPVRLRTTKGDAVMAACGQLGDGRRVRPLRVPTG